MDDTEEHIHTFGASIHSFTNVHHRYFKLYQVVEAEYVSHKRRRWTWLHYSITEGVLHIHKTLI